MTANDGKQYDTDCLNQNGIKIDEQSKRNAYELYENSILETTEVGTVKGLS